MSADPLNRLTISSPCLQDWSAMTGNNQVRFCEHCSFQVHNISQMTRTEALRLVAQSKGRLCVRYYRNARGDVITRPPVTRLHKIARRASRLAAGAFSATLSLSSATAAQPLLSERPPLYLASANQLALGGILVGTITDINEAAVPGAAVRISNQNGLELYANTNDEGQFRFDGLSAGNYTLQVTAPGFATLESEVYVEANGETRADQTLQLPTDEAGHVVATMGAVAFVAPEDPFIKAAQEDNIAEVQALLAEADINLRDKRSRTTALEHAVQNGNRELVQLLLSRGADVNAKNSGSMTVLMMIDENSTSDLVWDLVNAGADVHAQDESGNTALIYASYRNNVEALKTLIEAGARVGFRNSHGQTALMMASSVGLINNVRTLLIAGSILNEQDKEGRNALMYSLENEQRVVVRFLRSHGAVESCARAAPREEEDK